MLNRLFLLIITIFFFPPLILAQTESETDKTNVFEKIQEESEGKINIIVSEDLQDLILATPKVGPKKGGSKLVKKRLSNQGYRIQVFSDGRNAATLQARAKARGNAIAARIAKFRGQVYTFSRSPNWYTTVGNFQTQAEASAALQELRAAFPAFASEMRVIKSPIVILK